VGDFYGKKMRRAPCPGSCLKMNVRQDFFQRKSGLTPRMNVVHQNVKKH
jgi:hypothetical protein